MAEKEKSETEIRAELGIVASILSSLFVKVAGDGAVSAMKSAYDQYRSDGPVSYRVIASWFDQECYYAAIEFYNNTLDGAYLEKMWVTSPKLNFNLQLSSIVAPVGVVREYLWKNAEAYPPVYLPPRDKFIIALMLRDDKEKTLYSAGLIKLINSFTLLCNEYPDEPKQMDIVTKVLLRNSGPIFRASAAQR